MSPKQTMLLIANERVYSKRGELFVNAARDRVKDSALGLSWGFWFRANALL